MMKKAVIFIILLLLSASFACCESLSGLTVTYLDVGQGDAILVQCDGQAMMIDGGDYLYSLQVLSFLKNSLPDNRIDYLVCTHPHNDHAGGLNGILSAFTVGKVYANVTDSDLPGFRFFAHTLRQKKKSLTVPPFGLSLPLGAAQVTFLSDDEAYMSDNDRSLIVRVVYGNTSFLFMGDAEAVAEERLRITGQDIGSTVLKVGHHGSSIAANDAFLDAVRPQFAVISVGQNNDFGHPDAETVHRLENAGVKIYRTDLHGSVTAVSDGFQVTFTTEKDPLAGGEAE